LTALALIGFYFVLLAVVDFLSPNFAGAFLVQLQVVIAFAFNAVQSGFFYVCFYVVLEAVLDLNKLQTSGVVMRLRALRQRVPFVALDTFDLEIREKFDLRNLSAVAGLIHVGVAVVSGVLCYDQVVAFFALLALLIGFQNLAVVDNGPGTGRFVPVVIRLADGTRLLRDGNPFVVYRALLQGFLLAHPRDHYESLLALLTNSPAYLQLHAAGLVRLQVTIAVLRRYEVGLANLADDFLFPYGVVLAVFF
jgi:hypothetical protein